MQCRVFLHCHVSYHTHRSEGLLQDAYTWADRVLPETPKHANFQCLRAALLNICICCMCLQVMA